MPETNRNITMHPYKDDGTLDPTINVYPNVKLNNIKEDDGTTTVNLQKKITISDSSSNLLNLSNSNVLSFDLNTLMEFVIKSLYPIGSIFATFDNDLSKTPNNYLKPVGFVGSLNMTWVPIYDTFLYAAASGEHTTSGDYKIGDVGGSKDTVLLSHTHTFTGTQGNVSSIENHTHTITIDPNGEHTHTVSIPFYNGSGTSGPDDAGGDSRGSKQYTTTASGVHTHNASCSSAGGHAHTFTPTGTISSAGTESSGTGKNMPPYTAIRMWKRTA